MKIQCDVCNKAAASTFCVADEAALCEACDHRVHHANILAGKHLRFSLLQASPKQAPLCDICQERRAFLFCQEDRAILCRECDYPIHKANEHTQKHNRFLLTGLKLSPTSTLYSSSSSSSSASPASSSITDKPQISSTSNKTVSSLSPTASAYQGPASVAKTTAMTISSTAPPPAVAVVNEKGGVDDIQSMNNDSTSSISEYLMEMLPGWHVEDLFDSASLNGFSKASDNDVQSFWDYNLRNNTYSFSAKNCVSLWVPQVPPRPVLATPTTQTYPCAEIAFGPQIGFKDSINGATNFKPSMKRSDDNSIAVPQICPPSTAFKRSRTL